MTLWLLLVQLAVWQPVKPPVLHQGHWQSCGDHERALEHRVNGKLVWEMHLGPYNEFALYDHAVDGDHDHADRTNLLAPGYRYESRAGQAWTVPKLRLWVSVVQAGEGKGDCVDSAYYVMVRTQ